MAFSETLTDSVRRKGQTAMLCELCENHPKLKWKCLDCKLMMCQRCRDKVHNKIASAQDHTIIHIKDISTHQAVSEKQPDLTKLKCEVHRGQNCCLFCKTCQELVCQSCITKTHNKHEFGNISDEYKMKIEKIRNGQKNIKKEMRTLTLNEQKLKKMKSDEQSNYKNVKQEILAEKTALVNKVKKHTNKLLKELDQKWEAVSKYIDGRNKKLVEQQEQMQKQTKEINILLHQSNAKDVIIGPNSLIKSMEANVSPKDTSFQGVPKFTYGDKAKIPLILGKLEDVSILLSTELQVDKKLKTDFKSIDSVVSSPDGSLWIWDSISEVLKKTKQIGDKLSVICKYKIEVHDAALLDSGDLLMAVHGSSNLKLKPSDSTDIKDSVFTVSPHYTSTVHVTCDNKVVVGAVNAGNFTATGHRQIILMDHTGCCEKVFEYDRHNKPLFTYPFRINSNSKGTIAVIDFIINDGSGRVVVLDEEGNIRNVYTGHPDVNNEDNPFKPGGITATPSDNFVVTDINNNTLHILNGEGEIFTFYNTEEMGILLPYSLSFSTTGQLYIGCNTYDNEDKADIFVINNFFF